MEQLFTFGKTYLSKDALLRLLTEINTQDEEQTTATEIAQTETLQSRSEPLAQDDDEMEIGEEIVTPVRTRANYAVDVSAFPNFEAALRRFSSRTKSLVRDYGQRQKGLPRTGKKRRRVPDQQNVLDQLSVLGDAIVQENRRKAARGELLPPKRGGKSKVSNVAPTIAAVSSNEAVLTVEDRPTNMVPSERVKSPDAALIFIEFLSSPPKFGVIKDKEKPLIGFPFGGLDDPEKNIYGQSPVEAALREAREEFFFGVPVTLSATEENIVATLPGPNGGTIFLVHVQVPANTPYHHGEEQTAAALATEEQFDNFIQRRLILPKHKDAWRLFKAIVLVPRSIR